MKIDLGEFRHRYLDAPWAELMEALKEIAHKVYRSYGGSELRKRRDQFLRNQKLRRMLDYRCWTCPNPAEVRHHVILLKHGGHPTTRNNLVALCRECHGRIHAWLAG